MRRVIPVLCALAGLAIVTALVACGSSPHNPQTGRRIVDVVAGENPWGDIARQLGGPHAHVTSLITDPNADPHLFASNAHDALTVAEANLVIVNGLGYDDFVGKLLSTTSAHGRRTMTVAHVLRVHGANPNPHLWYDVPRVPRVAAAIERALASEDPRDAPAFRANLVRFDRSLAPVRAAVATLRRTRRGVPVAYTERVAGYLLAAAGLRNATPSGFAQAIEDGTDPSARDTAAMESLIARHAIRALLVNTQTPSPVTNHVRDLARRAGIPVVGVTETLPRSAPDFQIWQLRQLHALQRALG